ncbi:MAG TPA: DUF3817 domain-containing protein [Chthoniobacterales bacterium]
MTTNPHPHQQPSAVRGKDKAIGSLISSSVGRLRILGYIEGVSLLLLVALAVPLKYAAGIPQLVAVLGPLHGAAFIIYWLQLLECAIANRWTISDIAKAGLASFIPLGFLTVRGLFARKDQLQPLNTPEDAATS